MKNGFTNVKDIDREILLHLDDINNVLLINSYFYDICNEQFFRKKLEYTYPGYYINCTECYSCTYKKHFQKVNYICKILKETHLYTYTKGNPIIQLRILTDNSSLFQRSFECVIYRQMELFLHIEKLYKEKGRMTYNWILSTACARGYLEFVKYIIFKGADIHYEDDSALKFACEYGHIDVVKYLIEKMGTISRNTVLDICSKNNNKEIINLIKNNSK